MLAQSAKKVESKSKFMWTTTSHTGGLSGRQPGAIFHLQGLNTLGKKYINLSGWRFFWCLEIHPPQMEIHPSWWKIFQMSGNLSTVDGNPSTQDTLDGNPSTLDGNPSTLDGNPSTLDGNPSIQSEQREGTLACSKLIWDSTSVHSLYEIKHNYLSHIFHQRFCCT